MTVAEIVLSDAHRAPLQKISINRDRQCENHHAVTQCDPLQQSPACGAARAPVDLVPKQVRDRDPEQSGEDEQIGEHCNEQTARFVT